MTKLKKLGVFVGLMCLLVCGCWIGNEKLNEELKESSVELQKSWDALVSFQFALADTALKYKILYLGMVSGKDTVFLKHDNGLCYPNDTTFIITEKKEIIGLEESN